MRKKYPFPIVAIQGHLDAFESFLNTIEKENLIERIWKKDWTLWGQSPEGLIDRLGWLEAPLKISSLLPEIRLFVDNLKKAGLEKALIIGMGGSSLAPEVFSHLFPSRRGYLSLDILDSTIPQEILKKENSSPFSQTIYIISSKSGETTETNCLFAYFFTRALAELGEKKAPTHFVVITDPSSPLEIKASSLGVSQIWLADRHVGGRFSALTVFGLVPAALKGIDLASLLDSAQRMMADCQKERAVHNVGAILAAFLASCEAQGRNKLLFYLEPGLESLGEWIEQLVAESTGKLGKGFLPVLGHQELLSLVELEDVAFITLTTSEHEVASLVDLLAEKETPSIHLVFQPQKDIGGFFFLWEWAIALTSFFLKINPFDQPDVEKTKSFTQKILKEVKEKGFLPPLAKEIYWKGLTLFSPQTYPTLIDGLKDFFHQARKANYLSFQAFLDRGETKTILQQIIKELIHKLQRPVTLGWGPRYLHSTGQYHKGGGPDGFFLQLIATETKDLLIPENPGEKEGWLTFGILKEAQARADYLALSSLGKKIIQLHLGADYLGALNEIKEIIVNLLI